MACGTAVQALDLLAGLKKGQSVLITGASGAVGSAGVQYARSVGAHIVGVCSTANVAYDVIFDAAGASSFGAARGHLAPGGFYINTFPKPLMFLISRVTNLLTGQTSIPFMLKTDAVGLQQLASLAAQRVLQPRIARTVELEGVVAAQRDLADGKVHGKVCVQIGPKQATSTSPAS